MPKRRHDNDRIWRLENRLAEVEATLREKKIEVPDVLAGTGVSVALNRARRVVTIGSTYDDSDVLKWKDEHSLATDYSVNDVVYELGGSSVNLFRCILDHTSGASTGPGTGGLGTNWEKFGAVSIDDLSDVVLTSPQTNAILRYSGGNWIDSAILESMLPSETPPIGHASTIYFNGDASQSGETIPIFTAQTNFVIIDIEASEDGAGASYGAYLYVDGSQAAQFSIGSNAMSSTSLDLTVSEGEEVQLYIEGEQFPIWFSYAFEIQER